MTDKQNISALMDGELIDQTLIAELENDTDAQQSWRHYHLISDTLKGETPNIQWDIASKVSAALENEASHSTVVHLASTMESQPTPQKARTKLPSWLSNITQIGIAACVSMLVIFGVQDYSTQNTEANGANVNTPLPVLKTVPLSGFAEPVSLTAENINRPQTEEDEAQRVERNRRLNALMQDYELQLRLNSIHE